MTSICVGCVIEWPHRVFLRRSSSIAGSIEHGVLMRPFLWWQLSV